MKAPWERDRGPHTTTTATVSHEQTATWLEPITSGSVPNNYTAGRGTAAELAVDLDLEELAADLAESLGLPAPDAVWAADLGQAWGNCSGRDVIVARCALAFPTWVIEGIIVHELAHLAEPGHGPAFKALVHRYPLAGEVDGYLNCAQERDWGILVSPHHHNPHRESP